MPRGIDIRLSDDEIWEFVAQQWSLVLGTTGPDGYPHLVSMAFGLVGGSIGFSTYRKSQKVQNISRDPRVTCLVEVSGAKYGDIRGVMLTGQARLSDELHDLEEVGRATSAALSAAGRLSEGGGTKVSPAKRVAVLVDVERVVSWDHARFGIR